MINVIAAIIVIAIIGGALGYIIHAKRQGVTCIGCPHAQKCASSHQGCSCGSESTEQKP